MSRSNAWLAALAVCALVLIVDQATKQAAIDALYGENPIELPLGFQFDYVTNSGIAFGLFSDGEAFVILVTVAALGLLVGWFATDPDPAASVARDRTPHRRRPRQPRRPGPRGRGHRLRRPAELARLQHRGRRDHARRRDPAGHLHAPAAAVIVHQDEWVVVVDKPAGLVVHPAPGTTGDTLVDLLEGLAGGEEARPGIVHRLDKDTSGLMVAARSDQAHTVLSAQIAAREVEREYIALVEGRLGSRSGTIDAPIGRSHRDPTRMAVAGRAQREARTHFEVDELLPRDTLLRARLETGRTHQIRAHFAAIDHPVAGDRTYGSAGRHGLERQFLHSHRLAFVHPGTGEKVEFASGLPPDLAGALERARAGG